MPRPDTPVPAEPLDAAVTTADGEGVFVELGRLLRLAVPIVLTQMTQMAGSVADAMMAGRESPADLAGIALGGSFFWAALLAMSGIIMALSPTVSQLDGAGRRDEIAGNVRQALWLAVFFGVVMIALLLNVEPLYHWFDVDPIGIPIAVDYLNALCFGVLPLLGYFTLRNLCDGLSWTLPAMVIALAALALKVPLNYLLIYGNEELGVPAFGGAGCGWSSAIVMTGEFIAMLVIVIRSRRLAGLGIFASFSWPHWPTLKRLIRLGAPIGASLFAEISIFSVFTLLVGSLGVGAVAAHQIASNFGGVTFMVPMAIGMAASIRVGFNVGAGDYAAARRSAFVACALALFIALIMGLGVFFGRYAIASLYTLDPDVLALGARILIFVAAFQIVDSLQVAAIGSLRGFKDTFVSMLIALTAYWFIALPVGAVLGLGWFSVAPMGLDGFWTGLTAGLAVAAVLLVARLSWLSNRPARIQALSQG